ncbi:unnamed protein product [Rotaria sp. Silwood1]|nr:unnamed protein product [Rotaria sp. Silwood1]CAF4724578.1 unnamed protein product [Rotaria sp. Silwood1]
MSSNSDTVFVNLHIDGHSSFSSARPKTDILLSKGSGSWNNTLCIILTILCIIGIVISLIFIFFGKKFKKNKRSRSGTITTSKDVEIKGTSPYSEYQPVPNV